MTFAPYPHRSGFIFLGLAVIFGGLAAFLVAQFPAPDNWPAIFQIGIGLLVSLVLLALALYWTLTAFQFTYHLNRNGVIIQWGLTQKLIPFNSIKAIIPGQNLPPIPKSRGLNIAGLQFGWTELSDYGPIEIHATAGQADSLLIVTPNRSYLVSPRSPDTFLKAWQVRQRLGPTQHWSAGIRRSWPLNLPVLSDPVTWWLSGLALLTYLCLLGYLSIIFANLPQLIPIHYDAFGQADRIADKSALFILPAVGAIVLGVNTLLGGLIYRWERVAAYLLWGSAVVMQACLWVALLTIT
jgi:hypothetical protein